MLGIIGVGHMAGFIVEGLCRSQPDYPILLSPRNREKAAGLSRFAKVETAASNQEVADRCDVVLVTLRPGDAREVLGDLVFRPDQTVVSGMAGVLPGTLGDVVAPAQSAAIMMIGHSHARGQGPICLFPDRPDLKELLAPLGRVIVLRDESAFLAAASIGGFSGLMFLHIARAIDWFEKQGLSKEQSMSLVAESIRADGGVFLAADGGDLENLIVSKATPGGITELGGGILEAKGAFDAWDDAMDAILDRMTRQSRR